MMKKFTLFSMTIGIAISTYGQSIITVPTSLKQVTVYKAGAALEHTASVQLPAGNHDIVLTDVSNQIVENSIQVSLPAQVTLLSVITAKDYFPTNTKSPTNQQHSQDLKQLYREVKRVESDIESVENTLEMILKNDKVGSADKGTTAQALSQMANYYLEEQKKLNNELIALEERKDALRISIDSLSSIINAENHHADVKKGQIILQVTVHAPTKANLTLQYLSPSAGWVATYDLKAHQTNAPILIQYKAKISQGTGIDWKNVHLKLSTGLPTQGGIAPTIQPWVIAYQQPIQLDKYGNTSMEKFPVTDITKAIEGAAPGIQVAGGGGQPGSGSGIQIRGRSSTSAANAPLYIIDGAPFTGDITSINPADIDNVTTLSDATTASLYGSRGSNGVIVITTKNKGVHNYTQVQAEQLNATFDISVPYTILSNNKGHTVMMQTYQHAATFNYVAVPKMDQDVYLIAKLANFEQLNLIPGEANIIFENMYVGKTYLNPYTTEDTLKVSMGKDKGIQIERKLIPETSTIRTSGSTKRQVYEYEITIRNSKREAIQLTLMDQYPLSHEKSIEIDLKESGGATVDTETGILHWYLNIPATSSHKVRFKYEVKYPKDKQINM